MTAEAEMVRSEPPSPRCWCCDGEFAEVSLVRLGARPEVTICLDCARFLNRRALARRHTHRWTPMGAVRGVVERVRDWVIKINWHRRGLLGAFLGGLYRVLP